ncbi:MAG: DUF4298 domain-containing protein [Clostridiales bacterium]|nr:DUF4298 domain-containing protein [Clostridiales bacterium]
MESVIERIQKMEQIFDTLTLIVNDPSWRISGKTEAIQMMDDLLAYYESGLWLKDYEMDEKGLIPNSVKRGVLSEDGVYNLINEYQNYFLEKEL